MLKFGSHASSVSRKRTNFFFNMENNALNYRNYRRNVNRPRREIPVSSSFLSKTEEKAENAQIKPHEASRVDRFLKSMGPLGRMIFALDATGSRSRHVGFGVQLAGRDVPRGGVDRRT